MKCSNKALAQPAYVGNPKRLIKFENNFIKSRPITSIAQQAETARRIKTSGFRMAGYLGFAVGITSGMPTA